MSSLHVYAATAFWVWFGLVLYAYALYPLVIFAFSRWFGRRGEARELADEELPFLSLLIAAHDEETVIGATLGNALSLDYPPEKLEIVVASDGSTDRTVSIAQSFRDRRVCVLDYPARRGKAAVLNASIPAVRGEIVLLSDANTVIDSSALRRLVRWFRRPEVGTVCGRLVLVDPRTGRNVDSLYWRYETFLKRCEARLGALLGANGAIYAIRKDLYVPLPEGTIVDDFVIPLLAKLRSGCDNLYDCDAVASEETPADVRSEFHRRSRIGAGAFQSLGLLWRLLEPGRGWVAFTFFSHKVLRWLCPFFLIGMIAANLLLWGNPVYHFTLGAQLAFYSSSVLAGFLPAGPRILKPLRLATMFTGMNLALFVGFCRWLSGTQRATWRPTARVPEAEGSVR